MLSFPQTTLIIAGYWVPLKHWPEAIASVIYNIYTVTSILTLAHTRHYRTSEDSKTYKVIVFLPVIGWSPVKEECGKSRLNVQPVPCPAKQ